MKNPTRRLQVRMRSPLALLVPVPVPVPLPVPDCVPVPGCVPVFAGGSAITTSGSTEAQVKAAYSKVFEGKVNTNSSEYKLAVKSKKTFKAISHGFKDLKVESMSFDDLAELAVDIINAKISTSDAIVAWSGARQTAGQIYQQGYWQNG